MTFEKMGECKAAAPRERASPSVSILALSVSADALPPLPKGEAMAAYGQWLLNLGYALALPLGELAKPLGFD